MKKLLAFAVVFTSFFSANIYALEDSDIEIKSPKVFYEFGSIVRGVELGTDTINNQWAQRFGGMFEITAKKDDNFQAYFGIGGIFWHALPERATDPGTLVFYGDAIITKAYGNYLIGDPEAPVAKVNFGYFPLKYSLSKNLGEYLFRTGTYPNYIITGNPLTTVNTSVMGILGLSVSHNIGEIFSHSIFLTSERQTYPLHDFSLSYLAKLSLGGFSIGTGLKFNRLIPITPSNTTPTSIQNSYFNYQGVNYTFNEEYYYHLSDGALEDMDTVSSDYWADVAGLVDSLEKAWQVDSTSAGKPAYENYSFKGINALLFASLNFNSILGMESEDVGNFNIYSEAVLMGVENKPIYYENRMERLAVMFGLNLPTFGLLNDLNFEVEYFPSKFVNGYREAKYSQTPTPDFSYNTLEGYDPEDWKNDDLKWSVYLSRKIMDGLTFETQIASDHLRGRRGNRVVTEQSILVDKNHWYYMFKLQAAF